SADGRRSVAASFATRRSSDLLGLRLRRRVLGDLCDLGGLGDLGDLSRLRFTGLLAVAHPRVGLLHEARRPPVVLAQQVHDRGDEDRKSTRLTSSHVSISYAVS